ncbi:MAG: GNAT family N-acetyltransferase [Bacteroidota bacterium]
MTDSATFYALSDAGARAAYADLLGASAQRTPFSDLPFADAACAAFGLSGHLVLAGPEAADAGLVVFEKQAGPFRAAALPPYAEFVTPVLRAPLAAADVHRSASGLDAIAEALGARVHQASLRLHPSIQDVRPLTWAGWTASVAYHMEAPITGEAGTEAWGRYTRKTVRRHADTYVIREGRDQIPAVVDLAASSMAAKGMGHPPADACVRIAEALADAGQARAFVAVSEATGDIEAGVVVAHGGETAYYWMVGSAPGPAMTVLLAHVAQVMQAAGCTRLHLGGANVPSVAEFKRGFGGELMLVVRARFVRGALRLREAIAGR